MSEDYGFTKRVQGVELNKDIRSFKDCPNRCVDGYFINPYTHRKTKCVYCASKRRSMIKDNLKIEGTDAGINKVLNLPDSFTGDVFDVSNIIPDFAKKDMIASSIEPVENLLSTLYRDASVGEASDTSLLFNLGKRAFEANFIYAYMLRAYQAGLSVSPYVTDFDIRALYDGKVCSVEGLEYQDLLKTDVCVVTILASATSSSVLAVKGLMEFRSHYDKSTIIFTNSWGRVIRDLCTEEGVSAKNLAYLVSIEYTDKFESEQKQIELAGYSKGVTNLTSEQFNALVGRK